MLRSWCSPRKHHYQRNTARKHIHTRAPTCTREKRTGTVKSSKPKHGWTWRQQEKTQGATEVSFNLVSHRVRISCGRRTDIKSPATAFLFLSAIFFLPWFVSPPPPPTRPTFLPPDQRWDALPVSDSAFSCIESTGGRLWKQQFCHVQSAPVQTEKKKRQRRRKQKQKQSTAKWLMAPTRTETSIRGSARQSSKRLVSFKEAAN